MVVTSTMRERFNCKSAEMKWLKGVFRYGLVACCGLRVGKQQQESHCIVYRDGWGLYGD